MRPPAPVRSLLSLPLYYKIVIANIVITLSAVLACASLVRSRAANDAGGTRLYVWLIIVIATIAGIAVNSIVVRIALSPVRNLVKAAEAVQAGAENVRAEVSPVSDAATADVVTVFNNMLDSLAAYRGQLREIAIRAIGAGEAEKSRLSRELHDGTAQRLAAALLQLRVVQRSVPPDNAEQLAAVSQEITASIDELRILAQSLRPPSLDMIGMTAALLSYTRQFSDNTGVRAQVSIGEVDHLLPKESEVALYRIVQDALQNVAQHAKTNQVRVDVLHQGDHVEAIIADEGRGFDAAQLRSVDTLGMFGMHERALYVGGSVEIDSAPGSGTVVRIMIPIGERTHG